MAELIAEEAHHSCSILAEHFFVSVAGKGALADQKEVEDEPQTEDITDWFVFSRHVLDVDDLWSNVARSTAAHEQVLRFL